MRAFDFYEFAGIIAPGVVLITSSLLAVMEPAEILDMNLGGSFIIIIIAYVLGHLLQGVGNGFEYVWWKAWRGMPTDWIKRKAGPILSNDQRDNLFLALEKNQRLSRDYILGMSQRDWFSLTRSMYIVVEANGSVDRLERFNGNYGLLRGVTVSCFISGALMFAAPEGKVVYGVALMIGGFLSSIRMHRFAKYYARELFLQYVGCAY